jgi:hypothetical protein
MAKNSDKIYPSHAEVVKRIFENKGRFHRQQARLPIEEKIRILIELQKISLTLRPNRGPDDPRVVWQVTP